MNVWQRKKLKVNPCYGHDGYTPGKGTASFHNV